MSLPQFRARGAPRHNHLRRRVPIGRHGLEDEAGAEADALEDGAVHVRAPVPQRRKLQLKAKFESGPSYLSFKIIAPGGFNTGFIGSSCAGLPWRSVRPLTTPRDSGSVCGVRFPCRCSCTAHQGHSQEGYSEQALQPRSEHDIENKHSNRDRSMTYLQGECIQGH